jgi:hypothetical protein
MLENHLRLEMWDLALTVAYVRLGLIPLQRDTENRYVPPKATLETMPPDEARKSKRKYRKLWRRELARQLREFERAPSRVRKSENVGYSVKFRGRWRPIIDSFEGQLLEIAAFEVGEFPSICARGYRWDRVKSCKDLRKELLKAAIELGLCPDRRAKTR